MKTRLILLGIFFSLHVLSGCSVREPAAAIPTPTLMLLPPTATLAPSTATPQPTVALPTLQPTPAASPTPRTVLPISASVEADNFLLRTGPGRLFERVAMYNSGSQVSVIGRAVGDSWVLVQTEDYRSGWMKSEWLSHLGDFSSLPIYTVPGAVTLTGHLWNADKSPAAGFGMAIFPAGSSDYDQREDVTTRSDGAWYAFLPENSKGDWEVQVVSCPASMTVEQCRESVPPGQRVTLPDAASVSIEMSTLP